MSSTERSARLKPRARLVGGGPGLIHLRVRGPALGAQILGALLGGGGLRQHAGGGTEFGLGLLGLQLQIDFIEGGQRLADIDGLADLDQAFCHLAGDPEAHVGLDPGLDGADEAALRRFRPRNAPSPPAPGAPGAAFSATFSLQPVRAIASTASDMPAKSLE